MSAPARILQVEDDPDVRLLTQIALKRLPCELQVCVDGASALASHQAFQPDLVLLDLQLPDLSGLELFVRLRQQPGNADLYGIILSASEPPQLPVGILGHIRKPFNPLELATHILALWASSS
jgi:CheY-like chemotaxis protein